MSIGTASNHFGVGGLLIIRKHMEDGIGENKSSNQLVLLRIVEV